MPICESNDFMDAPFNLLEFNVALQARNPNSSPGIDGIDFEVMKKLPIKYKLILLDSFNEMYSTTDFPEAWKKTYVHLITKPGNTSHRPIALMSCLCKPLESMIKNRL